MISYREIEISYIDAWVSYGRKKDKPLKSF